ncbi:ParB/RepB/Spo0J family partition protein [Chroococcus sp. FPU101]|uniref:ParB/RepB/Spo0J family partition protein n=1 Tax=Chroococcus sp. FPU101 TaxID=1974212 RepID=UPI001A8E4D34|nr:ParB/RepB/Spo0J family partition protein [Chroococcus sp. FPU101]GFE72145.1 parB-like partition protein [Chroococcus sp. FPU101]
MPTSKTPKQPYQINTQGIDLLFGADDEAPPPQSIPLKSIQLPPQQPRRYFDPQKLESLITSIQQQGILQPLIVRPLDDEHYELVAGERRYRAAQTLALDTVPVVIRTFSNEEAWEIALLENLQREDLNPVEETEAILQLLANRLQITSDEVIALINLTAHPKRDSVHNVMHSEQWLQLESIFTTLGRVTPNSFRVNRLPLLKLPDEIKDALNQGQIDYTKAKAIASLKDPQQRRDLLEKAVTQSLSLSQIKEEITTLSRQAASTPIITPQKTLSDTYQRLKNAQLWKDPQKWKKAQTLLKKLEELIEENVSN